MANDFPENLEKFVDELRVRVHALVSNVVHKGYIDDYTEYFDEEKETWTIELSFNRADPRELKIKIDINPDE